MEWNGINSLGGHPSVSSLKTFLREMNDFKHIWWALTARNKSSSQKTYDRYQNNNNYNQAAERFINELTSNKDYRYKNQYYQNQFMKRYRENYNNIDNYNSKDEYAVYDFDRQSQCFYLNWNYYFNRNQLYTYDFAFVF